MAKTCRVVQVLKAHGEMTLGPCHPLVVCDQLCPAELAANTSFPFPCHGAALVRAAVQPQAWRYQVAPALRLEHPTIPGAPMGSPPGRDPLHLPGT